jgi:mono/diheme cytochrome c family protein
MRVKLAIVVMGLTTVAAAGLFRAVAAQGKSQWDGVYTEEQAKRGEATYSENCASCHGPDMAGGEMAPGLAGGEFSANWNDLSLGQLFERMRTSMPQNNPGSLSRQQNADILAFILRKGTAPAAQAELPTQTEVLNQIKFLAMNPNAK